MVGKAVGLVLRDPVGLVLGNYVGPLVLEGDRVGLRLGDTVGLILGDIGLVLGCCEGPMVGDHVELG